MTLHIQALSLVVGVFLPILVGIVTTRVTSPGAKAVLLAALSAVSGILTEYLGTPADFNWAVAGLTWLGTFAVAVATHFGLWKPTGTTAFVQDHVGPTAAPPARVFTGRNAGPQL